MRDYVNSSYLSIFLFLFLKQILYISQLKLKFFAIEIPYL